MFTNVIEKLEAIFHKESKTDLSNHLTRLIQLRAHTVGNCDCSRCADFLTKMHYSASELLHQHKMEQWGLFHWLSNNGNNRYVESTDCIQSKKCRLPKLDSQKLLVDHMVQIENEWQAQNCGNCLSENDDDFWRKHWQTIKQSLQARYQKFPAESDEFVSLTTMASSKSIASVQNQSHHTKYS